VPTPVRGWPRFPKRHDRQGHDRSTRAPAAEGPCSRPSLPFGGLSIPRHPFPCQGGVLRISSQLGRSWAATRYTFRRARAGPIAPCAPAAGPECTDRARARGFFPLPLNSHGEQGRISSPPSTLIRGKRPGLAGGGDRPCPPGPYEKSAGAEGDFFSSVETRPLSNDRPAQGGAASLAITSTACGALSFGGFRQTRAAVNRPNPSAFPPHHSTFFLPWTPSGPRR